MLETTATIARQYIDAVSVFEALEEAEDEAAQVRRSQKYTAVNKDCFSAVIVASNGSVARMNPCRNS
jgi:hypothetical protein